LTASSQPSIPRSPRRHRAFVVEKGTPGFSVGRTRKMGPPHETAGLVPRTAAFRGELLGGEEAYIFEGSS
jgi:hypothetical protein